MHSIVLTGLLAFGQAEAQPGPTPAQPVDQAAPSTPVAAPLAAPSPNSPAAEPAKAESPNTSGGMTFQINLTTLDLLRKKGLISEDEFSQAKNDLAEWGKKAGEAPTFVVGKFATTVYGFIEADIIHDDTRGYIDLVGNTTAALPNSEGGLNGQTMFSVRNSRLGFRLQAPDEGPFRTSALLEADFLGNQAGNPPLTSSSSSYKEASFFNNPAFRIRHAVLKIDTKYVSLWLGQTWELMGWQSSYQPNSVEIQGLPGEIYSRTPQARLVGHVKFGDVGTLELAIAALRPPQEDAQAPDMQAGIRFSLDQWKGQQTVGSTGTDQRPASIAITGGTRSFTLATGPSKTDWDEQSRQGEVIAGDIMIPAIPPSLHLPIALTLIGESSFGSGDSDIFTSLTGGVGVGTPAGYPACPTAGVACYPASYNPGIDPGMVGFNKSGQMELVDWRSVMVGAQLYLNLNTFRAVGTNAPPDYRLWISGNYSSMYSDNSGDFSSSALRQSWFADANLFYDLTAAVRLGIEYAHFQDNFASGSLNQSTDNRVQFSGFFIF